MEGLIFSHSWTYWLLERGVCSLLLMLLLWCLSSCWRTARSNQKLALGDALEYAQAERRGLLLPVLPLEGKSRY